MPEVTTGQGAASSASQGTPQVAPPPQPPVQGPPVLPTQGQSSFKGPPHRVFVAEIRPGPNEFRPPYKAPSHFGHGPRERTTPARLEAFLVAGTARRFATTRRTHLPAEIRGQLQAPWQVASQSFFASTGTGCSTAVGIRPQGLRCPRPEQRSSISASRTRP